MDVALLGLAVASALIAAAQDRGVQRRNPREHPLTVQDAVWMLPGVVGKVVVVPDLDGDGLDDLVVHRGTHEDGIGWLASPKGCLESVSSRDARTICALDQVASWFARDASWDAGGDVDGDGTADVIVGDVFAAKNAGWRHEVEILSAATGELVLALGNELISESTARAVAFVGDLDGDGRDDFAVGAPGGDPRRRETLVGRGYVVAFSGREGRELWRAVGSANRQGFGSAVTAIADCNDDDFPDLLIRSADWVTDPMFLVSGANGSTIRRLTTDDHPASPAGDLDGDGITDLVVLVPFEARFFSGADGMPLFQAPYIDHWGSDDTFVGGLGDLDGDGLGEIVLGEPNFHLLGPGDPGFAGEPVDVRSMTMRDAIDLNSESWCMTWESGCTFVYSGKTRPRIFKTRFDVILGFWGRPGSRDGIGRLVVRLPDITNDGWPDVLVLGGTRAYAIPGPGAAPTR